MSNSADIRYDRSVIIPTLLGILSLAVVLQWDVSSRQLLLFLSPLHLACLCSMPLSGLPADGGVFSVNVEVRRSVPS